MPSSKLWVQTWGLLSHNLLLDTSWATTTGQEHTLTYPNFVIQDCNDNNFTYLILIGNSNIIT